MSSIFSARFADLFRRRPSRRRTVAFLGAAVVATASTVVSLTLCGCAGYNVGPRGLYDENIQTIFVPMVEADTYRAAFGERLTEAICKKITEQTPYSLAGPSEADATLSVRLVSETQSVSAFNRYDDTRQKSANLAVVAVLRSRRGGAVLAETAPLLLTADGGANVTSQGYLVAEMGQSNATAQQEAIDKIADQIVGLLESGW
ncbi:MAG: hypothetical protein IKK39_15435 [Thermoguttaceae bacterium]|nr:hypothetical protein [Thermoguttaceae bacterium]